MKLYKFFNSLKKALYNYHSPPSPTGKVNKKDINSFSIEEINDATQKISDLNIQATIHNSFFKVEDNKIYKCCYLTEYDMNDNTLLDLLNAGSCSLLINKVSFIWCKLDISLDKERRLEKQRLYYLLTKQLLED